MASDPSGSLQFERRDVSVLSADIRNFSAFAANRAPEESAALLHAFCCIAVDVVEQHGGVVENVVGDSVLAVWNAYPECPDHSRQALAAAQELLRATRQLLASGKPTPEHSVVQPLALGVGLETGTAIVGSFGPARRRAHAALGEPVSVASRIQKMTLDLSIPILLGPQLAANLTADAVEPLGEYLLEGLSKHYSLYAPAAWAELVPADPQWLETATASTDVLEEADSWLPVGPAQDRPCVWNFSRAARRVKVAGMALPTSRWVRHFCLAWMAGGFGAAAHATSVDLAGLQEAGATAGWDTEKLYAACTRLALAPWPSHPASRRAYLQRLDGVKASCMAHPQFLATLGALWLEEGEPSQALIWLERALLLDSGHLGALADHALALAAMGQPAARDALALEWRDRADVPAVLRERLSPSVFNASAPLPSVRLGGANNGDWASYRELSVLGGYESNLDQSPKLAEITLTPPGGPIDVPLGKPLAPRRGAALSTELSWQVASSPSTGRIVRAGVNMGTRVSPAESDTNWRHVQLAASVSQIWMGWRGQVDLGGAWVAGALNEPYRILRTGISLERAALGCGFRVSVDGEGRSQSRTEVLDGRAVAVSASTQCALWGTAALDLGAGPAHRDGSPSPPRTCRRRTAFLQCWTAPSGCLARASSP